jgi:hypothetical protein
MHPRLGKLPEFEQLAQENFARSEFGAGASGSPSDEAPIKSRSNVTVPS